LRPTTPPARATAALELGDDTPKTIARELVGTARRNATVD
jgi:hypothetical protein